MTQTTMRPAWVVPTILVGLFAIGVFLVRVAGQDVEHTAFPTQGVPEPSASVPATTPGRTDHGLALSATGVGPHRFGDPDAAVLAAMSEVLGPPTDDAIEECGPDQQTRWVRWADLSIRLHDGQFVAFIEGIYYPPGPPPLGIPTAEGLVAGDPAARLFELYDRDSLTQVPAPGPAEQDAVQFEIADDGTQPLVVVVEGGAETGQVVAISAGSFCPPPA